MKILVGAAAFALACAGTASANECVTEDAGRRVTLDCRGVSLGTVLRGLGAVVPIDLSLVEPIALDVPVYVAVDAVPVAVALQATLDASGTSFVLYGTADEPELRVFATPQSGAATAAALASRPPTRDAPFEKEAPEIAANEIAEPEPVAAIAPGPPEAMAMAGRPDSNASGKAAADARSSKGGAESGAGPAPTTGEGLLRRAVAASNKPKS